MQNDRIKQEYAAQYMMKLDRTGGLDWWIGLVDRASGSGLTILQPGGSRNRHPLKLTGQ